MKNLPDERAVYLALRGILQGDNAQLRRLKKVKEIVQKHQHQSDIRNLITKHKAGNICQVAVKLLKDQIFESTLKAKVRFPEVFEVSPTRTAERAISESEAAKHEDAAMKSVMQDQQQAQGHGCIPAFANGDESNRHAVPFQQMQPFQEKTLGSSFYPIYLPFNIQHQLLTNVQRILEKTLYAFASKNLAGVLQEKGWDCAEAVELNRWPEVLQTHQVEVKLAGTVSPGRSLHNLLSSAIELRHTTVHRMRLTANKVLQFTEDAEALAILLQEEGFSVQLSTIRRQTQGTIEELERHKDLLGTKLEEVRRQTAAKIVELKRHELEAVGNAMKEDSDYTLFAGESLRQALNAPDTAVDSPTYNEDESSSDSDTEQTTGEEDDWIFTD